MTHHTTRQNDSETQATECSLFGAIISSYSRAQAIEDGELVDVSETAREAGITYPVALTRALWEKLVALTPAARRALNDESGRLWDVIWMLRVAIKTGRITGAEGSYQVLAVTDRPQPTIHEVKTICGPGDTPAPVITLMLPDED